MAIIADGLEELKEKLEKILQGEKEIDGVYLCDNVIQHNEFAQLLSGKPGEAFRKSLIEEGDLHKIAGLWTQGLDINWNDRYINKDRYKISLPGYAFEKKEILERSYLTACYGRRNKTTEARRTRKS